MPPRIREHRGRPPPEPGREVVPSGSHDPPQSGPRPEPEPEPEHGPERDNAQEPPLRGNDRLYNTLQALSARLADIQSCDCPADCAGPDPLHTPTASSQGTPRTPQRGRRCREVIMRSSPRQNATVTAEAEASMEVQLPRLGSTATGTLRMTVTVHTCPDNLTTRRGYYAELFLRRPEQEEEEHIGYFESWRILRPNAEYPERNNDWIGEFLPPSRSDPNDNPENMYWPTAKALQTLYTEDGEVQPSFEMFNIQIPGPSKQETSPAEDVLGPHGAELVYISLIWIDFQYSGNGILRHALNTFYRLLMGGTLHREDNIRGRAVFVLEPGVLENKNQSKLWREIATPRKRYESQYAWTSRVESKLRQVYERYGFQMIRGTCMARYVEPQTAERGDQLRDVPDPPPRAPSGETPPSTFERREGEGELITTTENPPEDTDVQDPELQELEDDGEYIAL